MNKKKNIKKTHQKDYKKPDVEIIAFDYKDVISTSVCDHLCDPFWENPSYLS